MTAIAEHALTRTLRDAARGSFPSSDRKAEVGGQLPGPCDAVAFFANHLVVAADVSESWVQQNLAAQLDHPTEDRSNGLGTFLGALSDALGRPPSFASTLTAASRTPEVLKGSIERGGVPEAGWAAYRTDIECYQYRDPGVDGTIAIGRGPGDRLDAFVGIDNLKGPIKRASRDLLTAAKTLIPDGEVVYTSAPLHDARSLRTVLGSGFTPICTEVLFLTRPKG